MKVAVSLNGLVGSLGGDRYDFFVATLFAACQQRSTSQEIAEEYHRIVFILHYMFYSMDQLRFKTWLVCPKFLLIFFQIFICFFEEASEV